MFFGHICPPRSTHTAPMPFAAGSVHAHILTKPSRVGAVGSHLEWVEIVPATYVFEALGWGNVSKTKLNRKIS